MNTELAGKRLELLKESVPMTSRVAVLWNPANPAKAFNFKEIETAAKALALSLRSLPVRNRDDFDGAFEAAVKGRVQSLFVSSDGIINSHRKELVNRIAKNRLPAMYTESEWIDAGGLMVYGAQQHGSLSPCSRLCRQNSKRNKARRFACRAADEV